MIKIMPNTDADGCCPTFTQLCRGGWTCTITSVGQPRNGNLRRSKHPNPCSQRRHGKDVEQLILEIPNGKETENMAKTKKPKRAAVAYVCKCGNTFESYSRNAKQCPECAARKNAQIETLRAQLEAALVGRNERKAK